MVDLIWLVPGLPLAGFTVLIFAGRRIGEPGAGWLATGVMGGSFLATLGVFIDMAGRSSHDRRAVVTLFEWIPAGDLSVDIGFLVDPLS
ncbi:MAG TPA: NADH-quinone oxidoreductase subunit L, partial [Acidimicrobiales bacterium]|nr:NADH-quinone oxidoreductase subunit L [Acidimicrobiales bacterium]